MMLLRSVNHVRIVCDAGHEFEFDDDASADFMRGVSAIAQGYRSKIDFPCIVDGCKCVLTIDVTRAKTFLRIWTI